MNACFRCRTGIDSGETFCSECRQVVELDFGRPTSWGWRALGWGLWGFGLSILAWGLSIGATLVASEYLSAIATGVLSVLPGAVFFVATILIPLAVVFDVHHLHQYDAEWQPNKWLYYSLAVFAIFTFLLSPLLGLWYRYRRPRATAD